MLLRVLLSLTFFVCASGPAVAGTVETNVRICGVATPYQRYGEPALGIFGNTSTGVKDQFFRIKGILSIESNVDRPKGERADAIVDFSTAVQLRGVRLCVRGNLETIQKTDKVYYYVSPKIFQLSEKVDDFLSPSQLPNTYSLPLPSAPTLSLSTIEDPDLGRRYFFPELPDLLRSMLGAPCTAIDAWLDAPSELSLTFVRREKTLLTADATAICNTAEDIINLHFEFRRTTIGDIVGVIHVERDATAKFISLDLHR